MDLMVRPSPLIYLVRVFPFYKNNYFPSYQPKGVDGLMVNNISPIILVEQNYPKTMANNFNKVDVHNAKRQNKSKDIEIGNQK